MNAFYDIHVGYYVRVERMSTHRMQRTKQRCMTQYVEEMMSL